jgi:hypothetical protein
MKGMNFQPGLMTPEGIQSLVAYLNWLVVEPYPSKKYEFVSWDYYSQKMESHKSHVPNHQPTDLTYRGD